MAESVSLSQRILDDVRGRILSGEWPPGHRLPSENELAADYGCSRMTANKAMSSLAKSGLIERRRKAGSVVARQRSQAAVLEIHDIRTEVEDLGLPYRYELVDRRKRAAAPEFPLGTQVISMTCRHFAGARPFCLEERAISLAAVPDAADETFMETAPGPWLLARVPWSAAEHTIRAAGADARTAEMLAIPAGSACLVVERRTWSAERPITAVRLTYPGPTHSLVARFAPRQV